MSWKALLAAGFAFSGSMVGGTVIGIALAIRTGSALWTPAGLLAGFLLGAGGVAYALRHEIHLQK